MVEFHKVTRADAAVCGMRVVLGVGELRVLWAHYKLRDVVREQVQQLRAEYGDGGRRVSAHHDGAGALRSQKKYICGISRMWDILCHSIFCLYVGTRLIIFLNKFTSCQRTFLITFFALSQHSSELVLRGQTGDHVCLQLAICVHDGAFPDQRALVRARHRVARRPSWLRARAADASAGEEFLTQVTIHKITAN